MATAAAALDAEPGTPGGQYQEFTRAMMDDEYDREPIDVIAEAVFGKKGSAP